MIGHPYLKAINDGRVPFRGFYGASAIPPVPPPSPFDAEPIHYADDPAWDEVVFAWENRS